MNALQAFIQSKPCGFLVEADMPALIALDRLCQVLVRCGGCRFTCAAQDVAHLIKCIEVGGDYIRDVSFPVGAVERAANWHPEPTERPAYQRPESWSISRNARRQSKQPVEGVDWICTGNFDGFTCGTDADSGL